MKYQLPVIAASIALLAKNVSCAPVSAENQITTVTENGETVYYWPVDEKELENIREIFDDKEKREINLKGTWVTAPQGNCHSCGKKEDFLDSVYTASRDNVHSAEFMKRAIIENNRENNAPERYVRCANCDTQSLVKRGWASGFNWSHEGACVGIAK
jgi:hypothetical protein